MDVEHKECLNTSLFLMGLKTFDGSEDFWRQGQNGDG